MPLSRYPLLRCTAVLLSLLALVVDAVPHDGGHKPMEKPSFNQSTSVVTAVPVAVATAITATDSAHLMSYLTYQKYPAAISAHIILMTVAWVAILPVGVMLSVAKSRLAMPAQVTFLITNAAALLCGIVYRNQTPDLYENNVHTKIGWVATLVAMAQLVMGMLLASSPKDRIEDRNSHERLAFIDGGPDLSGAQLFAHDERFPHRCSGDSGQGSDDNCYSPRSDCNSFEHDRLVRDDLDISGSSPRHKPRSWHRRLIESFPQFLSQRTLSVLAMTYVVIERTILILGFFALVSGAVVYTGIFRGHSIFNGLAHFIKGGIFIWYGFLTLGRWVGCFADLGWAWNMKPSRALVGAWKSRAPTAEFTESFVIFLYGATNVFLEHLGGWGGPWTSQDLEHVSITIMFFGGGLCGMLAESRRVRDWVNLTALGPPPILLEKEHIVGTDVWRPPKSQGASLNPMPATVILLLGLMMSSHHQHSMTSTMVHKQWGMLLVGFSLARAITYVMLYINPPSSILPSRPPSELVASFCLISGGLIFMLSTTDIVEAMEYHDVNAMIVFTVGMGVTAMAMAWEIILISIKAWAAKSSAHTGLMRQESKFSE